jgi:hypothetical protein
MNNPKFLTGTVVGVIDPEKPNYGLIGIVKAPFRLARTIPQGWVWVEFQSGGEGTYSCEYDCASLVSIHSLGVAAFKKLIAGGDGITS